MDLNHRPPGPEPGALARLRYAPTTRTRARDRTPEWKIQNSIALCLGLERGELGTDRGLKGICAARRREGRDISPDTFAPVAGSRFQPTFTDGSAEAVDAVAEAKAGAFGIMIHARK